MNARDLVSAAKRRSTEEALRQNAADAPESERVDAVELMQLERVTVSLVAGGEMQERFSGQLLLLRSDGPEEESVSFLMVNEWYYPLVGQPVMWNCPGEYILPRENGAAVLVVDHDLVSQDSTAELDARLSSFCQLRDRSTGTIMQPLLQASSEDGISVGVVRDPRTTEEVDGVVAPQDVAVSEAPAAAAGAASAAGAAAADGDAVVRSEDADDDGSYWGSVASGVQKLGQWTATGITVGAQYTGYGISRAGGALRGWIDPLREGEEHLVSETTRSRLNYARTATAAAVTVTTGMLLTVTEIARGIGTAVGQTVESTEWGQKLAAKGATKTGRGLRQVGLASLSAIGTVWVSMEDAAKVVGSSVADATTETVRHRYGEDYASATAEGFAVSGNLGLTAMNLRNMGTRALLARAGGKTAGEVLAREHRGPGGTGAASGDGRMIKDGKAS